MRNIACDCLFAGAALALSVAMPTLTNAAPDRGESVVVPLPPAVNEQPPQHQDAAPVPKTPPAAAALQNSDGDKLDLRGTLDKPSASLDAQISDRLREIATGKELERRVERAPERQAIEAFYAARNFAPLWIGDGRLNARATSVIDRLKDAAADGLDPADYPVPELGAASSAEALADGEIELTNSMLTYARHLAAGRIAPTRVLTEVAYGNHTPEPADILSKVAEAGDAGAALESFNPPHTGFRALKAKLAELRAAAAPADTSIAKRRKPDPQIERVIANMERWRWLPRDLGETYVMVNIPDYTLTVVHDHETVWRTKIVAGKPQTPTPLLTASMQQIIVNPSWHVPQSIIRNELLPRYSRDPNIFARMGLVVKHSHGRIEAVQPPGARNALGRIKFDFPNEYSVYLHDTPEKRLFASDKRAFSHGCMRVENPTKFGEVIMSLALPAPAPNEQQINRMFGRNERTFGLVNRPMVHLTYQTAFVDDAGELALRDDIYGFDARIEAILHGGAARIAGAAPPQALKPTQASARTRLDIRRRAEQRAARNPANGARAWPVAAAAPGFRAEAPPLPLLGPFLAIFSR